MSRAIRGAVLLGLAGSFLVAACEPSPPVGDAEAYLLETTALLRGLEYVQALRADCNEMVAGLEQYVETLR